MANVFTKALGAMALIAMAGGVVSAPAVAQEGATRAPVISTQSRGGDGEQYIPGIWVDPDGCEHWVMDDGVEGYMTPRTTRKGLPVCNRGNVCGVMNSDQFFATDSHHISRGGKAKLAEFFNSASAQAYVIAGHTDSRASDDYNLRLSYNRAMAVARVAQSTGANVVDVRGYGERWPVASNASTKGMAKNRRVEIICIK